MCIRLVLAAYVVSLAACCNGSRPLGFAPPTGHPVPEPPSPSRDHLRIMTYNVNFGLEGDPAGIDAITAAAPDVVLLQETTPAWERALVVGLGSHLPHHHFEPTTPPWAAGGMGVMSRWPILRIERLDGGEPFFALHVIVASSRGPLQLLGVHLRPPMSDDGSWVVGYFTTPQVRARELRAHLARLDLAMPTIVAGDFNEEAGGLAIAELRERGFASALAEYHPDAPTWHWPLGGSLRLRMQLDHVLHDERFRASAAGVVARGHSDHFPVWADLEWR
jgi:endonuclease/exonuclease/phosphatase family metal-dependent hydrolase